eukprot:552517_1
MCNTMITKIMYSSYYSTYLNFHLKNFFAATGFKLLFCAYKYSVLIMLLALCIKSAISHNMSQFNDGSVFLVCNRSATMTSTNFKSCLSTLETIVNAFNVNQIQNECQSTMNFGAKKQKLLQNMDNHKQHLHHRLKSIESSQETYKTVIENSSSINLNKQYIELQKDELELQQDVEQLQNESKLKQQHLNVIDDNENIIDNMSNEKKEKIKIKLPALKHKLYFYKSWFDIQWDNDINNKQIISGITVSNNQFEEFTFDKNEISQFDLVNKMWQFYDNDTQDEINELKNIINKQ